MAHRSGDCAWGAAPCCTSCDSSRSHQSSAGHITQAHSESQGPSASVIMVRAVAGLSIRPCLLKAELGSLAGTLWWHGTPWGLLLTSVYCADSGQRYRSATPSRRAREVQAQAQAPRAVPQLILHGRKVPGLLPDVSPLAQHSATSHLISASDCCSVSSVTVAELSRFC